jgi:hypothetical protein
VLEAGKKLGFRKILTQGKRQQCNQPIQGKNYTKSSISQALQLDPSYAGGLINKVELVTESSAI